MNHCTFVGRLTGDPESRDVGTSSVTKFSLAVEDRYRSNGEDKIDVDYFDFDCWGNMGNVLSTYAKKGDQLIVESRAKPETWEDKNDGTTRKKTVFKVKNFYFGAKKRAAAETA
jgi:single-strand DNA-binding protein